MKSLIVFRVMWYHSWNNNKKMSIDRMYLLGIALM